MLSWLRVALVAGACALAACGSSGSDSSGNNSGNPPPTTYTLGGTVSGVTASGLVLINNGTTLSVSSGATSFVFSSGLAAGTSYLVTVQSAPAGLTCSVANGSGTINSANVTNITVTCAPQMHTLGGTVSGLTANGLVLANGGATLTVNSGATTFSFPTAIATGTAYAVSVQSAPAGLTCSVANGTGTVGTADIANVVVTCSFQSYSLNGTITGLTVGGLVLANGTDRLNVPANATSFTMPTPVASTSGYAVTVATQPAGLSCSVMNGTGTVGAANVTNIGVACSDQSYTLGGTLTGLTTSGLVLANGSDTVSVAANATRFTLPNKVAFTTSYAVTVHGQPTGLTCTVSPATASGTMPAANVTNVAVVCADNSYTLGGTVTGLTVAGLTLANGTDTVSVPANATSFVFPTSVAYTSAFAVTIATQPNGWTCTVSSGSGNMPAANVKSVAVTCSINSYTLGGTINGLTGSGLVLTDGTDNLPVATNAAVFSMPTALAYGSSYTVSVVSQPIGMQCSVTNGGGTIPASKVTSVQVSCAAIQWMFEGGSTVNGAAGSYSAAPLVPSARDSQMGWTDSAGHFWLFGGTLNGGELDDVWMYDSTGNTWTLKAGTAATNTTGVYPSPLTTGGSGSPGGRHGGMVWADSSGNLWLFGGLGIDSTGADNFLNDLWRFNMSSGLWTYIGGPNTGGDFTGTVPGSVPGTGWPSARGSAAAWVDSSGRLWMFGGAYVDASSNIQLLDDLWMFDPTAGHWTLEVTHPLNGNGHYGLPGTSGNFPGARGGSATWRDSQGHFYLLGGGGFGQSGSYGYLADFWMLDPTTQQWTWLGGLNTINATATYGVKDVAASTNWPGARLSAVAWTDAAGNFWMFGGSGYDQTTGPNNLNDLWMFNPTTQQWAWVNGPNTGNTAAGSYSAPYQPGSRQLSGGWVDGSGHLWMFGGNGSDANAAQGDLNDLWRF